MCKTHGANMSNHMETVAESLPRGACLPQLITDVFALLYSKRRTK